MPLSDSQKVGFKIQNSFLFHFISDMNNSYYVFYHRRYFSKRPRSESRVRLCSTRSCQSFHFKHVSSPLLSNFLPYIDTSKAFSACKALGMRMCFQHIEITKSNVFFFRGGNAPSYVYRLLTDVYHPNDTEL